MRRDYIITFATTVLVMGSYMVTMRIVAVESGAVGFGEYALVRRVVSVLAPVAILGADFATARFVAHADGSKLGNVGTYPAAGVVVLASCLAIVSPVLWVWQAMWSQVLLGSEEHALLIGVLPALLLGVGLHSIIYNYLRGLSNFLAANAVMTINYVATPIVAAALSGGSVRWILSLTAGGWILVSVAFLLASPLSTRDLSHRMREVLRYGVPRVPGDLLQLALFAAPSLLVAHVADISSAGVAAFGTAALGMIGTALTPVSAMLLPISAKLLATNRVPELRHHVVQVLSVALVPLLAATVLLEVFAGLAVSVFLGAGLDASTVIIRIIALAAVPYGVYVSLRSVVDARHVAAINSRNMAVAVVGFVAGELMGGRVLNPIVTILSSFVFSICVLSLLTAWEAKKALAMDSEVRQGTWPGVRQMKR